jgi:hypothetical protein
VIGEQRIEIRNRRLESREERLEKAYFLVKIACAKIISGVKTSIFFCEVISSFH